MLQNEAFVARNLKPAVAMKPARKYFGCFQSCDWHDFSLWGLTFELTGALWRDGICPRMKWRDK